MGGYIWKHHVSDTVTANVALVRETSCVTVAL